MKILNDSLYKFNIFYKKIMLIIFIYEVILLKIVNPKFAYRIKIANKIEHDRQNSSSFKIVHAIELPCIM